MVFYVATRLVIKARSGLSKGHQFASITRLGPTRSAVMKLAVSAAILITVAAVNGEELGCVAAVALSMCTYMFIASCAL